MLPVSSQHTSLRALPRLNLQGASAPNRLMLTNGEALIIGRVLEGCHENGGRAWQTSSTG